MAWVSLRDSIIKDFANTPKGQQLSNTAINVAEIGRVYIDIEDTNSEKYIPQSYQQYLLAIKGSLRAPGSIFQYIHLDL